MTASRDIFTTAIAAAHVSMPPLLASAGRQCALDELRQADWPKTIRVRLMPRLGAVLKTGCPTLVRDTLHWLDTSPDIQARMAADRTIVPIEPAWAGEPFPDAARLWLVAFRHAEGVPGADRPAPMATLICGQTEEPGAEQPLIESVLAEPVLLDAMGEPMHLVAYALRTGNALLPRQRLAVLQHAIDRVGVQTLADIWHMILESVRSLDRTAPYLAARSRAVPIYLLRASLPEPVFAAVMAACPGSCGTASQHERLQALKILPKPYEMVARIQARGFDQPDLLEALRPLVLQAAPGAAMAE